MGLEPAHGAAHLSYGLKHLHNNVTEAPHPLLHHHPLIPIPSTGDLNTMDATQVKNLPFHMAPDPLSYGDHMYLRVGTVRVQLGMFPQGGVGDFRDPHILGVAIFFPTIIWTMWLLDSPEGSLLEYNF